MKTQNLQGLTARVNEKAYNTWLAPYIGMDAEIVKRGKSYVHVVTDYGYGEFGHVKCNISYFDFKD